MFQNSNYDVVIVTTIIINDKSVHNLSFCFLYCHLSEVNIQAQEGWEWRRFHSEELHSLYSSPIIVRLRWAGHVARMEEGKNAFNIFEGKSTAKRNLGRPRRRWEENVSIDLK